MNYKTIFVSDVHLATRFSKAGLLLDFLKSSQFESIFLVGDIIDGWVIKRKFIWREKYAQVLDLMMELSRNGTKVYYFAGNHDEFLRRYIPFTIGENIFVLDEFEYQALNGKKYIVMHGDQFDSVSSKKRWLAEFGDKWYNFLLALNIPINFFRKLVGLPYWSFSRSVKSNVKKIVGKKTNFREHIVDHIKEKSCDGIIYGHVHKAEVTHYGDFDMMNCGDWVESCTALVETLDGNWEIVDWQNRDKTK